MQRDDEDDAWRAIVENYGERPTLDDPPPPEEPAEGSLDSPDSPDPSELADGTPVTWDGALDDPWDAAPEETDRPAEVDPDAFVPPDPPLTRPATDRLLAWTGVLGAPAILLVLLVIGRGIPRLVPLVLVAWFVLGFLYLVWRMPREPRDPWDDGAQV